MRKRKKEYKILPNVSIIEMAAEGKCIAKVDEKVIFVDHAAPGDIVDLKILKEKKNFAEAVVENYIKLSDKRTQPFCEHFGICGGCKWQHLDYDSQLIFKFKQVKDNLERIAKIPLPSINPILGCNKRTHYRNKLEFTFSNKRWLTFDEIKNDVDTDRRALGFHIPGRFDKIIDLQNCYLQSFPSNDIRNTINRISKENNFSYFDLNEQVGALRNLIIRTSSMGEVMVIVQFFEENKQEIDLLLSQLKSAFPEITSLLYIVNKKKNETYHDQEIITYFGKPYITEVMEGISFRVGPKSFFQTNSEQAYELYKITREMAGLTGKELVYDLYTGTGTIANFIASKCKKVIGLEYVEMAIEDAKINSQQNNIANTEFFAGDIKDLLSESFLTLHGMPDVIITDPPRAGMHEDVVKMLLTTNAKKIVYVSCNPATQARDLAILDVKYKVTAVQPVDMFPHTHHVENVVLLEIKNYEYE